ncbi:MAG: type II and III secretion system protein family protein [Methyloligellaceae bacterium]
MRDLYSRVIFIAVAMLLNGMFSVLVSANEEIKAGIKKNSYVVRVTDKDTLPVHKSVVIGLNKSLMIELPRDVRDVLVSSPKMLDAVMHTSRRAYIIGLATGQANAFIFDKNGKQLLSLDIRVEKDLAGLVEMFSRIIPGSNIQAEMVNENIILTGSVANPMQATRARDIAARFVADKEKVLNMISVTAKEQVMLNVVVAEMSRDIIKRFGVNWNSLSGSGMGPIGAATNNNFPNTSATGNNSFLTGVLGANPGQCNSPNSSGSAIVPTSLAVPFINCLAMTVEAFERDGLLRTLAKPNLTAISGESAKFLAGGEFPVPVSEDSGQISIQWKPFGVGLSFTPIVMSEKRISLKVSSEVSELSAEGAVETASFSISALKVRRAETTVELPSGGSFVIAGLLSDETKQNLDGVPGLKNLPVLGTLFRSRDFKKKETELVIIVTPYIVRTASKKKLARPDGGFAPADDRQAIFFGQLNRVYGRPEAVLPLGSYRGDYGFIVK